MGKEKKKEKGTSPPDSPFEISRPAAQKKAHKWAPVAFVKKSKAARGTRETPQKR